LNFDLKDVGQLRKMSCCKYI